MKMQCIKSFDTPKFDAWGDPAGTHHVAKSTVWDYEEDYVSKLDHRLYSPNGDDDDGFIDVTNENFDECFKRIG